VHYTRYTRIATLDDVVTYTYTTTLRTSHSTKTTVYIYVEAPLALFPTRD